MSWEATHTLPVGTRISDVLAHLAMLGYRRDDLGFKRSDAEVAAGLYWREDKNYRSYSGVVARIFKDEDALCVYTRTGASTSCWDIEQQNHTLRSLKQRFGGKFRSDLGVDRYLAVPHYRPSPAEAGCHLAFGRVGGHLFRACTYVDARSFPAQYSQREEIPALDSFNPRLLSNNLLMPFLCAALEDYFKSAFVALLKFSERREDIFRVARLQTPHLLRVSRGEWSIEDAVASGLSFHGPVASLRQFRGLDPKLNLTKALERPYRRRKRSLLSSLEDFVKKRDELVHRGQTDPALDDPDVRTIILDLQEAVTRSQKEMCRHYGWQYEKGGVVWPTPRMCNREHR